MTKQITLVNLFPKDSPAKYLLSSYVLKSYVLQEVQNVNIEVIDLSNTTDTLKIIKTIESTSPDIVGYSCYVWNIDKIVDVVAELSKKENVIKHVLGGPEISIERIKSLGKFCDSVAYVIGEGEKSFSRIISSDEMPMGIARWNGENLVYGGRTELIEDLDVIPSPYDHIDSSCFGYRQAFVETQRGCKYRCKYCVYHRQRPSIKYFSLERVLDELDRLIFSDRPPVSIRFVDAMFTSDIERAKKIVRHMINRKIERGVPLLYWEFNYDSIDDEFLSLVSRLNVRDDIRNSLTVTPRDRPQHYGELSVGYGGHNCVGLQSFNRQSLKSMGRSPIDEKKFLDFMTLSKRNNVLLKIDLILGLPHETFTSYVDGLNKLVPHFKGTDHVLNIHRLQILPGSNLEEIISKFDMKFNNESPRYVTCTPTFDNEEFVRATKMTAMLFRVINSPLRESFFVMQERTMKNTCELIEDILDIFLTSNECSTSMLATSDKIDDEYWNNLSFKEIRTEWLQSIMQRKDLT